MTTKVQVYRAALRRSGVLRVSDEQTSSSPEAARVLHAFLADAPSERIAVVYLDGQNRVRGVELVAMGGLGQCAAAPTEIFRGAIVAGASAIVVGHNHPSGDPKPSNTDLLMTRDLVRAGRVLGIFVLDHLVVTRDPNRWTSLLEHFPGLFDEKTDQS